MVDEVAVEKIDKELAVIEYPRDGFARGSDELHNMDASQYESYLHARDQTEWGQIWSRYRKLMLDMAEEYLQSSESGREHLRRLVAHHKQFRLNYMNVIPELEWSVRSKDDKDHVVSAVAIVSLCDQGVTMLNHELMTNLWYSAKQHLIDVESIFKTVAELSSSAIPQRVDGSLSHGSTKDFLEHFSPWRR